MAARAASSTRARPTGARCARSRRRSHSGRRQRRYHARFDERGDGARHVRRRRGDDRPRRAGPAVVARPDRRAGSKPARAESAPSLTAQLDLIRALYDDVLQPLRRAHRPAPCAQASRLGRSTSPPQSQPRAGDDARRPGGRQFSPPTVRARCIARSTMPSTTLHGVLLHEFSRRTSPAGAIGQRGHPQRLAESGAADRARRQDRRGERGGGSVFRDVDPVSAAPVAGATWCRSALRCWR